MAIRMLPLLAVGLLFCAGTAPAQTFEGHYGAPTCIEEGRSVVPVAEGGYISVGSTTCDNCVTSDIYIVRTLDNGNLFWSKTYDFGGRDVATSVKEVTVTPVANAGFIVTGFTENLNSPASCNASRNDIFLLRLDRCGNVIWARTYGTATTSEAGFEVLEARTGSPAAGTNPGDFVVAGWTTFNGTSAARNGYIIRTTSAGNLIWDQVYNGPSSRDDYFYSVEEALAGASTTAAADIVAAGGTSSYSCDGNNDGWIVRVSGNSGAFLLPPGSQGAAAYGSRDFEEFKSIRELRSTGSNFGNFVTVGYTKSVANGRDVYVVQTGSSPCTFVSDRVFGDFGTRSDEGFAIRESNLITPGVTVPTVIITGYMQVPYTSGALTEDAFLVSLIPGQLTPLPVTAVPCTPTPVTGVALFGGDGNDRGLSVEPRSNALPCRSEGYIVTGFIRSPNIIAPDAQQLYLIKTDANRSNDCDRSYTVICPQPLWDPICGLPLLTRIGSSCQVVPLVRCLTWQRVYCYNPMGTATCAILACPACLPTPPTDTPTDTPTGNKMTGGNSESDVSGIVSLNGFPNPVKSGSPINVEYSVANDAPVNITVTDLNGRTLYSGTASSGTASIDTDGWSSGSYMVSVSVEGKSTTTRIVVSE